MNSYVRPANWQLARAATATLAAIGMLEAAAAQSAISPVEPPRAPLSATAPLKLHVPSPDWRDQIIYFLVTDRFNDGEPANNHLGAGEFDPASNAKYNGGDLIGIEQKLDYIRGLGATAIWITPPVANQWWDASAQFSGFHGYWAENFMEVDRHLGTLDDYRRLSHRIHSAGMYLVQDIVVNHTGNFFSYEGGWDQADPSRNFAPNAGSRPSNTPSQFPFSMNDARNPQHRRAGIYHWTPNVTDFNDPEQEMNFQMSGLDDLNTENPLVRETLRKSYGHWIKEIGVDAFRVDTAFYVPAAYFADFMYSRDVRHPGMAGVARRTGRRNFLVFGEGYGIDKPYTDTQSRKIERYMTGGDGRPLLPGMLNFPLYGAMSDVFARGRPTAELAYRIGRMMKLHKRAHLMPSFVDNHDVDRFLAGGSQAGLKQSLLMIMTLPGIPTIYYGTEQAFIEPRAAMFKAGFQSGGRDRFDTDAPLYRYIAEVSALRRAHPVFSRGIPEILKDNPATPGVLAYRMTLGKESALVVFNSKDSEALLDNLQTRLPPGSILQGIFGIDATPQEVVVGAGGVIAMKLAARSGQVWRITRKVAAPPRPAGAITIAPLKSARVNDDFTVSGTAPAASRLKLVIDGDLAAAQDVATGDDGRWRAVVDTGTMIDPTIRHSIVALVVAATGTPEIVSVARPFQVSRDWLALADVADPAGDDSGSRGTYRYPTDNTWGSNRQMDIKRVKVHGAGGALKVELTMNKVTTGWNPQNGFDHVAFTFFIQMPGQAGGIAAMPLQNATLPDGMTWHYRLRAHGWSNALFSSSGASADREGMAVAPAADIRVDKAANTVTFTLPATALGNRKSLSGAKLYITTWDYDGGYRDLTREAHAGKISGGDPAADARVMDDVAVITLP